MMYIFLILAVSVFPMAKVQMFVSAKQIPGICSLQSREAYNESSAGLR